MTASLGLERRENVSDSTQALAIRVSQGSINVNGIASPVQVLTVSLTRTFFNYSKIIFSKNLETLLKKMLAALLTN